MHETKLLDYLDKASIRSICFVAMLEEGEFSVGFKICSVKTKNVLMMLKLILHFRSENSSAILYLWKRPHFCKCEVDAFRCRTSYNLRTGHSFGLAVELLPWLLEFLAWILSCFYRPCQTRLLRSHQAGRTPDHSYHVPKQMSSQTSFSELHKSIICFFSFFMNITVVKINFFRFFWFFAGKREIL